MSTTTAIPAEMRERDQWLTWNDIDGKKIPNGKSNDPSTWTTFQSIEVFDLKAFVFDGDDPFTGIDLDGCIVDGEWTAWSLPILDRFRGVAYCEVSPSGTGVKLTTRGKKPEGSRCKSEKMGDGKQQIECYDHDRFWTVTGNVVAGFESIGDGQEAVTWLCETYMPGTPRKTGAKRINGNTALPPADLMQRAQAYADAMQPAQKGTLRDSAFQNAGHLHAIVGASGERLSDSDVYHLLRSWNARNSEPLRDHELQEAAVNGRKNGTPPADKPPRERQSFAPEAGLSQLGNTSKNEAEPASQLVPMSAADLITEHPNKRPAIIEGVIRRGETANVIGAAKAGKTWFIHNMLLSVAAGWEWFGKQTTQGRVLLIDNELHPEELASRLRFVAERMGVPDDVLRDRVDVVPLRGHLRSVSQIASELAPMADREYTMIALDAFYRALPEGISENDNAAMAQVYNIIDHFAAKQNAAIVLNHHSTKGDQSYKAVTDMGSGAGSISRAVDAHLTIRPHEIEDLAVLEGVFRSWAPMQPQTIRWNYPLWEPTHIEPEIKRPLGRQAADRKRQDQEADEKVIGLLEGGAKAHGDLRKRTGFGVSRLDRCLARLEDAGKVKRSRKKNRTTGKKTEVFTLLEVGSDDEN